MGFIGRWFGFEGWKRLNAKQSVLIQIAYKIGFAVGLMACIIGYSAIRGEEPGLQIIPMIVILFLIYQLMLNIIFVQGSR